MKKFLAILVLVIAVGVFFAQQYINDRATKEADRVIAAYSQYVDVEYESVSAGLLDSSITIKGISLSPKGRNSNQTFKIGDLEIRNIDTEPNVIPAHLDISLNNMVFDVDELGDEGKTFKELGYDQLEVDLQLEYQYNVENRQLEANIEMDIAQAAAIKTSFKLGGVNLTNTNWLFLLLTYSTIKIHSVAIDYVDNSLAERLNQVTANKQGISVKQVKQKQLDHLNNDINTASDPLSKEVYSAIYRFIEHPDRLRVTVSPEQPISLGELFNTRNQAALIRRIGLKISA